HRNERMFRDRVTRAARPGPKGSQTWGRTIGLITFGSVRAA
ncbi:MAG: hypothetical protein QOI35_1068, partial [Cryptosporangiaceae bacterium]|nr:hypothetical protein [Cryptosporangiaceae bacterium]